MQHYCGNTLKQTSINKEAVSCCADSDDSDFGTSVKKSCCAEKLSFFKTSDFEKNQQNEFVAIQTKVEFPFNFPSSALFSSKVSHDYSLPPPKIPVYKAVQRFLI